MALTYESPNIRFYKNEIPAKPNVECIAEILTTWTGNYAQLEQNHYYIQWLFPNRVPGVNRHSSVLTDEEAQIIRSTPELKGRVMEAFEMMLDFYGMRLNEENEFELTENSDERLKELNQWGNHNFQRITRILLALKELGHDELMLPWITFLADLVYKEKKLDQAENSFERFWIASLDAEDKFKLVKYKNNLLQNRPSGLPSKNTLPSPARYNKVSSYDKNPYIKSKYNNEPATSVPETSVPPITTDTWGYHPGVYSSNTTNDIKEITSPADTTPERTPNIPISSILPPVSDNPKESSTIPTTADRTTNPFDTVPESTPNISTHTTPSPYTVPESTPNIPISSIPPPVSDNPKESSTIPTTADRTTNPFDTVPESTPNISTHTTPSPYTVPESTPNIPTSYIPPPVSDNPNESSAIPTTADRTTNPFDTVPENTPNISTTISDTKNDTNEISDLDNILFTQHVSHLCDSFNSFS